MLGVYGLVFFQDLSGGGSNAASSMPSQTSPSVAAVALIVALTIIKSPVIEARIPGPLCGKGGYCSCETRKPTVIGYADEAHELKPMLKAAAYKKEVRVI